MDVERGRTVKGWHPRRLGQCGRNGPVLVPTRNTPSGTQMASLTAEALISLPASKIILTIVI